MSELEKPWPDEFEVRFDDVAFMLTDDMRRAAVKLEKGLRAIRERGYVIFQFRDHHMQQTVFVWRKRITKRISQSPVARDGHAERPNCTGGIPPAPRVRVSGRDFGKEKGQL